MFPVESGGYIDLTYLVFGTLLTYTSKGVPHSFNIERRFDRLISVSCLRSGPFNLKSISFGIYLCFGPKMANYGRFLNEAKACDTK